MVEEIENQISANQQRITLLSNLNFKLGNSARKLSEAQSRSASRTLKQILPTEASEFMKSGEQNLEKESWVPAESRVPSRAYPLFKLETEIEEEEKARSVEGVVEKLIGKNRLVV